MADLATNPRAIIVLRYDDGEGGEDEEPAEDY
jgi:hypothetical protein